MYPTPNTGVLVALATSGAAFNDVTHTLVAAPGATFFINVRTIMMSFLAANTGNIELRSGVAGNFFHCMDVGPTGASMQIIVPAPGFAMAYNQALTTISRSNVATQNFRVVVYYDVLQ